MGATTQDSNLLGKEQKVSSSCRKARLCIIIGFSLSTIIYLVSVTILSMKIYQLSKDVDILKTSLRVHQSADPFQEPDNKDVAVRRTKRDASPDDSAAQADTQKQRRQRNRRTKQNSQARVKYVDGIHMFSKYQPDEKRNNSEAINCGMLHHNTLTSSCPVMNIWTVDEDFQTNSTVTHIEGMAYIRQAGTYHIYAQLTYHDLLGSWSAGMMLRRQGQNERMLSQCIGMAPFASYSDFTQKHYPNIYQCQTSRVVRLQDGDQLYISDLYSIYGNRQLRIDEALTFWGVARMK